MPGHGSPLVFPSVHGKPLGSTLDLIAYQDPRLPC